VKVGKGTLKIGGILQAGFTFNMEDEDVNHFSNSFTLNRARFLFWGTIVPDKVKYFVQLDTKLQPCFLDYKAQFFYIEKTEIAFGRFLPNFTIYMPYSTAALEMINYPLTTQRYAMWRQIGIQSTTKTEYVDFNVGIFNGYPANNPGFTDDNDAKDFLGRVEFKPPIENANLTFGGFAWIGSALPKFGTLVVGNPDEKTLEMNRFGGFAKLDYTANKVKVKFRGEFLMASTEELCYAHVDSVCSVDGQAFFVHLGIQPSPKVEFLVRYDSHDPDKDMSFEQYDFSTTKLNKVVNGDGGFLDDDEETWLTIGLNYYLEGINSMFYLNFIHKMEPGQKNVWDEEESKYVAEDREFDNDQIVAQVQIVF
ncbi:MAG: hypothetical protein WBD28_11165, partial [Candidatus Zixiibacteriota bacterium]